MRKKYSTAVIVTVAVMAALIFVVTLFRVPLGESKIHFANAFCLLSGLLLGPVPGGLAAGMGSALYDLILGGYDIMQVLITFISKFLMAFVCGFGIFRPGDKKQAAGRDLLRLVSGCVLGSLLYVALYMLKTYVYQRFVYGYPMETVLPVMTAKLIPSLLNALAAVIAAPVLYLPLRRAIRSAGLEHSVR